jgi:hypothetical protein
MDIGLGVTHRRAQFGVGLCTDVIKKIGIDIALPPAISFKIRDPILNPQRHLIFIAGWYNETLD